MTYHKFNSQMKYFFIPFTKKNVGATHELQANKEIIFTRKKDSQ